MTFLPTDEPIRTRNGHEWFYVLRGQARVILGDREVVIAAAQAAEFDTRIPHAVTPVGTEPVELIAIINRRGERIHLTDITAVGDRRGGTEAISSGE